MHNKSELFTIAFIEEIAINFYASEQKTSYIIHMLRNNKQTRVQNNYLILNSLCHPAELLLHD
jgi:hypothetical protein